MSVSNVGKDLSIELNGPPDESGESAEVRAMMAALQTAVVAAWPGAVWQYTHGNDTVPRVIAALAKRVAAHKPDPERGSDRYYGPLGHLVAHASGRTLVFGVELHAEWRGPWRLVIEPRLRRRLLGFITSDRIPGSRELDGPTATALSSVLSQVTAQGGESARLIAGDRHWQRTATLVFP
ncbi:MAG: hypothetical protein JNL28_09580 [Planctomycetes bacterium]|nr:hypothetical protein [Planctomycetota bacterium]